MASPRKPFGQSVAKRELRVDGARAKVTVEIGAPYSADRAYGCQFRIRSGRTVVRKEIFGVDEFQALELTLKLIPTYLRHTEGLPLGRMYAFEPGDDMGFPEVLT